MAALCVVDSNTRITDLDSGIGNARAGSARIVHSTIRYQCGRRRLRDRRIGAAKLCAQCSVRKLGARRSDIDHL